jgi:hypothetical protein
LLRHDEFPPRCTLARMVPHLLDRHGLTTRRLRRA